MLAGALTFVGLHYSNTGHPTPQHFSSAPVQRVAPPLRTATLSSIDAAIVRQVAAHFIDTAVLRRHVDDSWELTTAKLRQGMTRAQWDTGSIPVTPFPAKDVQAVKYRVDWTGENLVYLKVAIVPKATATELGQAFDIGLTRRGAVADHRWLVDYWVPSGSGVETGGGGSRSAVPATQDERSHIPVAFVFVPIGLFVALILGLPIAIFGRHWLHGRRALRDYHRHRA